MIDQDNLEKLLAFLIDESELATQLRQSSPFAGVLNQEERMAIFFEFERAASE